MRGGAAGACQELAAEASAALEGAQERLCGQRWQAWLVAQIGGQHGLNGVDEGFFRYLQLDDDDSETGSL
jgi:hypothetical protein